MRPLAAPRAPAIRELTPDRRTDPAAVAVGDRAASQALPSIRQLAVELNVSVITVKRAYFELERDGIIATHHGKGSVVAEGADLGVQIHQQELSTHLTGVSLPAPAMRLLDTASPNAIPDAMKTLGLTLNARTAPPRGRGDRQRRKDADRTLAS